MKVNRSELQTNDDIWNAVLSAAYGNYAFPTENKKRMTYLFYLVTFVKWKVEAMKPCSIGYQKQCKDWVSKNT